MDVMKKRLSRAVTFVLLCLLTAGCGKSGYDMKEVAGAYKIINLVEDGEASEELIALLPYGAYMYVELKEDGTGFMNNNGEKSNLKWDGKTINFLDDTGSEAVNYLYSEDVITVSYDDNSMVLQRLNDEELSEYNKTGGVIDIEALATKMYGDLPGAEDSASGDAGSTEDAALGTDTDGDASAQSDRSFFLPDMAAGPHNNAGYYEINEYLENGESYSKDDLTNAGISFDMMLNGDGTGYAHFLGERYDLSWLDGTIVVAVDSDVQELTYTVADNNGRNQITIADDISTMIFDYKKEADVTGAAEVASADGAGSDQAGEVQENSGDGSSNSGEATAKTEKPAGVPGGDGLVSEERLQKCYVWLSDVKASEFETTYEEMVDYMGVDGEFEKEEYSDHMQQNRRYYFWRSNENDYDFIYVNFGEDENNPGVYKITGYNSNGFSTNDAKEKYLDEVKAEEAERNKAAAANMKTKSFSTTIYSWDKEENVVITAEIPETGWTYNENKKELVESDDPSAWHAGTIEFKLEDDVADFDRYKDKFEDYRELDDRVIGGITMKGRTYKSVGYEWTQYIAQIDDKRALSISMKFLNVAEGTAADRILNSMSIK